MSETNAWPFLHAWAITAAIAYGLLHFTGWRRRTRILLSVLAPLAITCLAVWRLLRAFGGGAGRDD
jgi:hypothetical protein